MLNKITSKLRNFKNDENGASAIEYAVMAAILVGVIVIALGLLNFDTSFTAIDGAMNPP
ncbi:hypothetical protein [uncultured Zhongshania sp.]|uniref:Flp family type IVb pilin n=1 Tax=uncultured Zhongshania sp. TaxID=1642288 RepID=UPI0030DBE2E2|tara:strand:+ start:821 stop:997 length:177 start_codon:yes stop_codon:yes gene_type:complete